jgi:hypothetical protein
MVRSEAQRTLVKSPPELWAEISDPEALARHLGDFGEIRITRVQPEQKIEWEAAEASGSVVIKPSGWGTKVKLTVERELAAVERQAETTTQAEDGAEIDRDTEGDPGVEMQAEFEDETNAEAEPEVEPGPEPGTEAEAQRPIAPVDEPLADLDLQTAPAENDSAIEAETYDEPAPDAESRPRRGFLARLFGRRRARTSESRSAPPELQSTEPPQPRGREMCEQPQSEQPASRQTPPADQADAPLADGQDGQTQPAQAAEPEREPEDVAAPSLDAEPAGLAVGADADGERIAAELEAAEAVAAEQVTAVLTGVLDSLGAAHHRPFSRA